MYAIVRTGGKQYKVAEGDFVQIEKLNAEEGDSVELDQVLMLADGEDVAIGSPVIEGARVSAVVSRQGRAKKVHIIKFRRRKHSRSRMGHRQYFTEIKITGISKG
ncbi:MAG: 50S ribosomal protein L21 [Gammaproteobacteria bacterium]|nr:MAG: 50S ribosomal protein L21 [Gammaproteobacteria bacterium]